MILALGRAGIASCFEAWDVRRGARLWQAPLPRPGMRIDESRLPWYVASGRSVALAQASAGASGKGAVWTLALDTGRLRSLPVPEGYETRVLDARDGVLILRATRQRGTVRDELWAMDLGTGAVLWEKPLGSTGGAVPRWTARAVSGGVALLQALERPNRLAYEALDLRTGRSLASVTAEVEAASWEGVAWTDEAAWLTIASPYHVALRAGIGDPCLAVAEPRQLPEHRRQDRLHAMKKGGMRRGALVVRPGDHRGEFFRVLQETARSQTAVMTVAPGQNAGPEETHAADQILYVIEGEAEVRIEEERAAARARDARRDPGGHAPPRAERRPEPALPPDGLRSAGVLDRPANRGRAPVPCRRRGSRRPRRRRPASPACRLGSRWRTRSTCRRDRRRPRSGRTRGSSARRP